MLSAPFCALAVVLIYSTAGYQVSDDDDDVPGALFIATALLADAFFLDD